jgi:TonB family protein
MAMVKLFFRILFFLVFASYAVAQPQSKVVFGPVVTAHFTNLAEELNELEFQLQHQEISRSDYTRSKHRILIQKQYVERYVMLSGEDIVPDLQILTADEITTMLGIGESKSQSLRVGDVLGGKWQISGIEKRDERFFVLERTAKANASPPHSKINPLDVIETITIYEPDPEELKAQAENARPSVLLPQPQPKVVEVLRPHIRAMYLPLYTSKAREKKIEGKVVLNALFARDGKIKDLSVEQKLGYGLDESALEAAQRLTFDPPLVRGRPIDVPAQIIYYFTLAHTSASIQPLALNTRKGNQP